MQTDALTVITALGPNALYVLAILVAIGQPVEQKRVRALAKFSPNTMSAAVAVLREHRLVVQVNRYLIQAAGRARQLILGEVLSTDSPSPVESDPQKLRLDPAGQPGASIIEAPGYLVVKPSSRGPVDLQEGPPPLETARPSNIEAPPPQVIPSPGRPDVLAALDAAGIGEPARSRLAAKTYVTPDYITDHAANVRAEGKPVALAIWRMEQAWRPNPHVAHCSCDRCRDAYLK